MENKRQHKYNKHIKIFIPRISFDYLHYKLSLVTPEFEYDINKFYSIINDLANIKFHNAYTSNNGYIPMYSELLKAKYGNDYKDYMHYLIIHSVISSTGYYTKNLCYHFKLVINKVLVELLEREWYTVPYCLIDSNTNTFKSDVNKGYIVNPKSVKENQIVVIEIPISYGIGKYIVDNYNKELETIKHYNDYLKKMAYHFKDTIGINYEKAIQHTEELYIKDTLIAGNDSDLIDTARNQYLYRIRSILAINEGKKGKLLRFKRNNNNKRIDTNLTNLSGDLRQYINGYENMSYFDLSNSQPVLFNTLLKEHYNPNNPKLNAEIDRYAEITLTGNWYEYLMNVFNIDRAAAKKVWMLIAYSKNNAPIPEKKVFANKFPEICKVIRGYKKENHADFAIALQRIESKIFIDEICKELVAVDIIPYTLHDGLIVPKTKENEVYEVMSRILKNNLGKVPVISLNGTKIFP